MFGADIEVFAVAEDHVDRDPRRHNIVPAYWALGGDVRLPLPYGELYPDGAACEFTVEPARTLEELAQRIAENVRAIEEILARNDLRVSSVSYGYIGVDKIHSVPMENERFPTERDRRVCMTILGCHADENVYRRYISRPDPKKFPWRTLGGHIHYSFDYRSREVIEGLVTRIDLRLHPFLEAEYNKNDRARNKLYGLYGTYREKPYGLEYRTLPARFVVDARLRKEVFERIDDALDVIIGADSSYEELAGMTRREAEIALFGNE